MLPDYIIRESVRAKHVRFRVSVEDGLVVIIPKGFDEREIPHLLDQKRDWLERALRHISQRREQLPSPDVRPDELVLMAIGATYRVNWEKSTASAVSHREMGEDCLLFSGAVDDPLRWRPALRQWLMACGRRHLIPWLRALSEDVDLPVERISIRCQKTRWGSYSTKGTVSLNAQLLFLPRRLARYVLIHELCHARHADHSPSFWQLLSRFEPDAISLRAELKDAGQYVPRCFLPLSAVTRAHG